MRRLSFALNFPYARVRQVVRLVRKRGDEGWTKPLDAIVGLSCKIAVVKGDHVRALVSAVSGLLRVLVAIPIEGEHVLSAFPRTILDLHTYTTVLKPIEYRTSHFVAKTIPELEPVERSVWSIDLVTKGVKWEPPDCRTIVRKGMEAKSMTFDRGDSKNAYVYKLAVMGETVVEKFFSKETIEAWNVRIERRQSFPPYRT